MEEYNRKKSKKQLYSTYIQKKFLCMYNGPQMARDISSVKNASKNTQNQRKKKFENSFTFFTIKVFLPKNDLELLHIIP